ncbi:Galectin-8 [Bagarius yarrelli]|uniref:Galectin n=1 Tax=Bagarius yarrelli TaxID=175774 RepID=A0A556UYE8_BAGYA|nr:Galectin-8 [Bagarius yarrelli]
MTILGGLHPGEMVLIQGSVPTDADRFQVDFMHGSSIKPRADVAFHFNPRFKKNQIVCNTLQLEYWGKEEIHYLMPFRKGAAFEIIVLVEKDLYKVAVNGAHLLEYKHRIDLARVDTLSVSGKVQIQAIGIIPSTNDPGSAAAVKKLKTQALMIILCEAQQFKVAVNGAHQLTYKYRVQDLSCVDELEIIGDLQLLDVKIW